MKKVFAILAVAVALSACAVAPHDKRTLANGKVCYVLMNHEQRNACPLDSSNGREMLASEKEQVNNLMANWRMQ